MKLTQTETACIIIALTDRIAFLKQQKVVVMSENQRRNNRMHIEVNEKLLERFI